MASNPFDQFDTATANPFDQFDTAAATPPPQPYQRKPSLSEQYRNVDAATRNYNPIYGTGEALTSMATGAFGQFVGGPARFYYGLATGESPREAAKAEEATAAALTYQPRTKAGQVIAEYNPLALFGRGLQYTGGKLGDVAQQTALNLGAPLPVAATFGGVTDVGTQAAGQYFGAKAVPVVGRYAENKLLQSAEQQAQNVIKDKIWQDARSAGFVAPKSAIAPTATTTALEGFAGKTPLTEKAMVKNQTTTNDLIRQEFNIPKDTPLSSELFENLRANAGKVYNEVQNLPLQQIDVLNPNTGLMQPKQFNPKQMVNDLRQARNDARSNWDAFKKNGNPEYQKKANAAESEATRLENELDQVVSKAGQPDLMGRLRQARVEIAKLHQVENSFNPSSQNVDPTYFARLAQKNAPLTGNLKIIGDFANQFPRYVKETSKLASPGASSVNSLGAAVLGAFGNLKTAGLMATRGPVGSLMLSEPYQNMFVKPNYGPNMLVRGAANLSNVPALPLAATNMLISSSQGQQ